MTKKIEIFPIHIEREIVYRCALIDIILDAIKKTRLEIKDKDIIVIAQKIISKHEGRFVKLENVVPSNKALKISESMNKDPRIIELILQESNKVVKIFKNTIIVETRHGFVCANAGIDRSNVSKNKNELLLLPVDPDKSAGKIRKCLKNKTGKNVSVIITDTFGRPFRKGQTNIAIGISGIDPLKDYKGTKDMYGNILRVTEIAIIDEIAAAAELVMGKSDHVPIAIVRGSNYQRKNRSIKTIIRNENEDIFRSKL